MALGILYCKRALFQEAEKRLRVAVETATRNYTNPKGCEAFYYLGLAFREQGKEQAADAAFHKAAWSPAWQDAANYALAQSACRKGDFEEALEYVALRTGRQRPGCSGERSEGHTGPET